LFRGGNSMSNALPHYDSAIDAIWSRDPGPTQDDRLTSPKQLAAANAALTQYPDDIHRLGAVVKALFYGSNIMVEHDASVTAKDYYQGCILVLVAEGVDKDKLIQAAEMLYAIDIAIREA